MNLFSPSLKRLARRIARFLTLLAVCSSGGPSLAASDAEEVSGLILFTNVTVDSHGIYLADVAAAPDGRPLPKLRLLDAPSLTQPVALTPARVREALLRVAPEWAVTNWTGAPFARVARKTRQLNEAELKELLTAALQKEVVRNQGDLELQLGRAWTPATIPDEPFTLRLADLPASGLSPNFILRFELTADKEVFGSWQTSLQLRLWRDVWVARSPVQRGRSLEEAELGKERRDVLAQRESITDLPSDAALWEFTENLNTGAPLSKRSLRAKPLVFRGQMIEGLVKDGTMSISLHVEALEDGQKGQTVRVRNPLSHREFRGKVQDEQTIILSL